jgi:hypothetical protein
MEVEEHIESIGKMWSLMNTMSLAMATMMDEMSRTQGWPEQFIYGYENTIYSRGDEVVRLRILPAVNDRLKVATARPQVELLKQERFTHTLDAALVNSNFMTLNRVHPYWSQWFFGYNYLPKDNAIDLSREPRRDIRINPTTFIFRLEELDNYNWSLRQDKRKIISSLMDMMTLVPNQLGTTLRMVTESGDVDVASFITFTAPQMYNLFKQAQAVYQVLPDQGNAISMPMLAPPICYETTDFRPTRPAIPQNLRYMLVDKQLVSQMVTYPSTITRLYSDLMIPGGEELPFLGKFDITWDGQSSSTVDIGGNDDIGGGDDYTE